MVGTDRGEVRLSSWSRAGVGICQDHVRRRPALPVYDKAFKKPYWGEHLSRGFSGFYRVVHYRPHWNILSSAFLLLRKMPVEEKKIAPPD